ncbi:hypothetical protein [Clostridium sp. UBA871]|uniref:hypothetical protein n=1 Tax=Clostridium sp. UBA871 TaxID=1946380 RepID=UPI00321804E1
MKGKMGKVICIIIIAGMFICSIYILIVKGMPIPGENVWKNEEVAEDEGNLEKEKQKKKVKKGFFK